MDYWIELLPIAGILVILLSVFGPFKRKTMTKEQFHELYTGINVRLNVITNILSNNNSSGVYSDIIADIFNQLKPKIDNCLGYMRNMGRVDYMHKKKPVETYCNNAIQEFDQAFSYLLSHQNAEQMHAAMRRHNFTPHPEKYNDELVRTFIKSYKT